MVLPPLAQFGVSPQAELVLRTLATFGAHTPGDLSRSLGMPLKRIHHALDELYDLEVASPDRQRRWQSPPAARILSLLRGYRHRLRHNMTVVAGQLATLEDGPCVVDDSELGNREAVKPLLGLDAVRSRITDLMRLERHEHLVMNPEPAFDAATIRAAAPADRAVVARGVSIRSLGVPAGSHDASYAYTVELTASGMQYRELSRLPTKMMVLDRRVALVPMAPGNLAVGAWEISAPATVARLVALFHQRWDRAQLPRPSWQPPASLSPREKAIVTLLAAGHTDSGVSAHLGLSPRTITYAMTQLMERYGAQNRFQLGLLIATQRRNSHE